MKEFFAAIILRDLILEITANPGTPTAGEWCDIEITFTTTTLFSASLEAYLHASSRDSGDEPIAGTTLRFST